MKNRKLIAIILLLPSLAFGIGGELPAALSVRITDGIGMQYKQISGAIGNHGFGGSADTLAADSTVQMGVLRNIKRIQTLSTYEPIAELLPTFYGQRASMDSSTLYSKWSAACWALNNYYASSGGISGYISARIDSGRLSPRFARVARANGLYLAAKTVFPESLNFGYASVSDTVTISFHDSSAIDSSKFGAGASWGGSSPVYGISGWIKAYATVGGGSHCCTLQVYGSNQNLTHGREWRVNIFEGGTGPLPTYELTPVVATDSLYNIDSVKIKKASNIDSLGILFHFKEDRVDSL